MCMKFLLLVVLVLAVGFSGVGQAEESVTVEASWSLSLDESGKVTALTMKPGRIKDALREQLEKAIQQWEFEPGSVNGEPAATETTLLVDMTVSIGAQSAGYDVKIDSVNTGGGVKQMSKPKFPGGRSFIQSVGAMENPMVVLTIVYDDQGAVESAIVSEDSPVKKGQLVDAAMKSIKHWIFEPERVAGHGVRASVYQPICFAGKPSQKCSWMPPGSDSATGRGESVALDSKVRLKSDVIGTTI